MSMEARETAGLIGSDKVEGTAVYGADGNKVGSIERVMIGKVNGKVAYAVLGFGGFLGIGDDHYPLPWQTLTYDTELGGYQVPMTNDQLTTAPRYGRNEEWDWEDQTRTRAINEYYGVPFAAY
jgi:PRC-barrel domain